MINESFLYQSQVLWFTCLVSKKDNLPKLTTLLKKYNADYKIVDMAQGQKVSRMLAWRFVQK
jgi:23S rRNA (adenine1618-N6)-methyltransferase